MFKFPGFPASSIFSSVLIVLAAAFMAVEGIWGIGLFHHWIFLTVVFLILLSLSFAAVKDFERKSWCRLTGHTGLALVLFAGLFGTTDCTDVQLRLFSGRIPRGLPEKLLSTASSLMLLGMLCGAVWAKQAWGDYWTWDAKECWVAVTWLLTLASMHVKGRKAALTFAILAFLAIQVTWYGVNYLPSSSGSLHTYNRELRD